MHITMVKKIFAAGAPCKKCDEAEQLLRNRGVWDRIDDVILAVEDDTESAGMVLGARYGVSLAPFFVVTDDDGSESLYTSVLKFLKEVFPDARKPGAAPQAADPAGDLDLDAVAEEYAQQTPQAILEWGLERYGADCAISFSGAEDVAVVDMAARSGRSYSVFSLDTGRLHSETLRFIDKVRAHYGIEIMLMSPDPALLEPFVREKGLFSFYEDGHAECCGIRKVEPLKRALGQYRAWVTGQRQDQSPATRSDLAVIEWDAAFAGRDGRLVKINPLTHWTSAQVWQYIRDNDVPYNELHDGGFVSIGCEPCTRPVRSGEHERAARWWWEDATQRECGLHVKGE